jgi:quercetin dioxygenase-like cupin family protein
MSERRFKIIPAGEGRSLKMLGDTVVVLLEGSETGEILAVVQQISQPGGGAPLHRHQAEDETFFVMEGEYEFQVGDHIFRATAGTVIFAPRGVPHRFQCLGPAPGWLQVTITPAGFEHFFDEALMIEGGRAPMGRLIALAKKYGVEFLGPPPSPVV